MGLGRGASHVCISIAFGVQSFNNITARDLHQIMAEIRDAADAGWLMRVGSAIASQAPKRYWISVGIGELNIDIKLVLATS